MRVIVIGAGLLGTSTAYFLARRGHEVVVIDRAQSVAGETSHANGGILHASSAAPWNAPGVLGQALRWTGRRDAPLAVRASALPGLARWGWHFLRHSRRDRFELSLRANARLAVYSLRVLRALRERESLDYGPIHHGCIAAFRDQAGLTAAAREAVLLADAGVRHEVLDRQALAAREPTLAPGFVGGLLYPEDESGDARLFSEELAGRARAYGAEFRLGQPVRRLLGKDGSVIGIATETDTVRGDAYVLAAGSHSRALARPLGLRLPIYPVKGYSITIPPRAGARMPVIPVIDAERKIVAAPLSQGLRVAGFAEFAGYDRRPDPRRARALLKGALELFPDWAADADHEHLAPWAGLRPTTPDGRPLLGPSPVDNLFLATGTGHLGWTFAAGAGRLVADAVTGSSPQIAPDDYGYSRIAP